MNISSMDFLLWVRGPGFDIAVAIFVLGMAVRLLEIFMLGRQPDLAEARGSQWGPGLKTILLRFKLNPEKLKHPPFTSVTGYIFHIGFFVTLLFFIPHIELIRDTFGVGWPGLPTPVVDATAVITMLTLLIVLIHRLSDPVKRFLSRFDDYLVWVITLLPVLTGYLAFHRLIQPYPLVLGIHILSVELLLVLFPFTHLIHAFTLFVARWYNGAIAGRRGVQS